MVSYVLFESIIDNFMLNIGNWNFKYMYNKITNYIETYLKTEMYLCVKKCVYYYVFLYYIK